MQCKPAPISSTTATIMSQPLTICFRKSYKNSRRWKNWRKSPKESNSNHHKGEKKLKWTKKQTNKNWNSKREIRVHWYIGPQKNLIISFHRKRKKRRLKIHRKMTLSMRAISSPRLLRQIRANSSLKDFIGSQSLREILIKLRILRISPVNWTQAFMTQVLAKKETSPIGVASPMTVLSKAREILLQETADESKDSIILRSFKELNPIRKGKNYLSS